MSLRSFNDPLPDLDGTSVLVTGGTGSFGHAFVRRLLEDYKLRRLIIFSRDELKQYEMAEELRPFESAALRFFIGDVRDANRLQIALRDVDYVIHAAALKQITTAEYNPFECIKTNVMGSQNVVEAAIQNRVKKVIALSTDKAANPANLYGASKLAADKIFTAANNMSGPVRTRFSVVRYGNVANSRGSVISVYSNLLARGAVDLPITDPRMTRFWITLPQAASFVLSSLAMMRGGEIFVPRIPSMRVTDIARCMAPHLPHRTIGIRPGEKLHEFLITSENARGTIALDDRFLIEPDFAFWERDAYAAQGGRNVAEDFHYSSENNDDWLSDEDFFELLRQADIQIPEP